MVSSGRVLKVVGGYAYDLEGVCDDANCHELLAVVAAVHHQRVREALNDGTLCLPEPLDGVSAGGVGDIDWLADLDVVAVLQFSSAFFLLTLDLLSFQSISMTPAVRRVDIRERNVSYLNILVAPFVEEFGAPDLVGDFLGKDRICLGRLNFDLAVRHLRCVSGMGEWWLCVGVMCARRSVRQAEVVF